MTQTLSPEQLATRLDKDAPANDTLMIDGKGLSDILEVLETRGIAVNSEHFNGYQIQDLRDIKTRPFNYAEEAAKFGGLTPEELMTKLFGFIDTRMFKPAYFTPSQEEWTLLTTLTITTEREDFVFGLLGGGSLENPANCPVGLLRIGVHNRESFALALSGEYSGTFLTCSRVENGQAYMDVYYGNVYRGGLFMTCLNSTSGHQYGESTQSNVQPVWDDCVVVSYDEVIPVSEFDEKVAQTFEELKALKDTLQSIKNNGQGE